MTAPVCLLFAIGEDVLLTFVCFLQATALEKKKCVSKLMEVCAKGGAKGVGKAKDGNCFVYQTGTVNYGKDNAAQGNPFWNWQP